MKRPKTTGSGAADDDQRPVLFIVGIGRVSCRAQAWLLSRPPCYSSPVATTSFAAVLPRCPWQCLGDPGEHTSSTYRPSFIEQLMLRWLRVRENQVLPRQEVSFMVQSGVMCARLQE